MSGGNQCAFARTSSKMMHETEPARRWALLADSMASIGLDQVDYGVLDLSAGNDSDGLSCDVGQAMHHANCLVHYGQKRPALDEHVRPSTHVGDFSPIASGEDSAADGSAYGIYNAAEHRDLRSGLLIPLPVPFGLGNARAAILAGAGVPEAQLRKIVSTNAMALVSIAHLFHARAVGELIRLRDRISPLTKREKDCLQLAATGLRVSEIAMKIMLAPVTVEMHLRNARRKFRCLTIPETVAKGLLYQQITHV